MRPLPFALVAGLCAVLSISALGCKEKPPVLKDIVAVTVDEDGFSPAKILAKKGRVITLVFTRVSEKTCATSVVIPSEHITQELPLNKATPVSFVPEKSGELAFACPMNMYKGMITVQP